MSASRFFSVLSSVLFLALCAYVGAAIYPRTGAVTAASRAAVTESVSLRGIAVREECAYSAAGTAENALRLPAGAPFGTGDNGETLFSPCSAVYFSASDGLETLSPDILAALDADALTALLAEKQSFSSAPRLVMGRAWYYAALADANASLPEGSVCKLLFDGFQNETDAYLISASAPYKGERVLLFRLTAGGEAYLSLRHSSAKLVIKRHEGLLVPAAALEESGGKNYVNTLTSSGESRAEVDIIYYPDGASALVQPHGGNLTAGTRVIQKERR